MVRAILIAVLVGLAGAVIYLDLADTSDPCEGIYTDYATLMMCQQNPSCMITLTEAIYISETMIPNVKACMEKQAKTAAEAEASSTAVFTQKDIEEFFQSDPR